jgi:glycosyltransferase involved in cell wall biosynthesis
MCFKGSRLKCLMAAIESGYNRPSGACGKFDLVIAPSEFYRTKLLESGMYIPRARHMKNFLPPETPYQAQPRGDYVFFFGRLSEEKGVLTLLRAMKKVDATLVIAGTGSAEPQICAFIEKEGLRAKVEMAGFQRGSALMDLLNRCACVVVPSEWYEASGYTACETQAAGKPVVVTRAGGLPENVVDGQTGIVTEMFDADALAEAINRILGLGDDAYRAMSQRAVENARHLFDADEYAKKLLTEYEKLALKPHAGGCE